jgi:biotin synthase
MSPEEILETARLASTLGYGTVVMQSGEDATMPAQWLAEIVREIKRQTHLAITLSTGERPYEDLALWREAGADRYLMRFETSSPTLYDQLHPPGNNGLKNRLAVLNMLRELDYEVGSGTLVGSPGQTWDDLANDILLFKELGLDMVGVGPFIPHPKTPAGRGELPLAPPDQQVPNTAEMGYKTIALTRILCPMTNIPSTTALATLNSRHGREWGLSRGANVIMPNLTPQKYRILYNIYPAKASSTEDARQTHEAACRQLHAMGRPPGIGRGDSPKRMARVAGRK